MKTVRHTALATLSTTFSVFVLALGMPAFSTVASATPSNYTASAAAIAIPATLDEISLTQAPSFAGTEDGIYELRSTISTYLGVVQLNHTGAFYGRGGSSSDLCYVGCSMGGAEKTFSLTFSLPAGTTAFAVRLLASDYGPTTYTITGPSGSSAQYEWGGPRSGSDRSPTFSVRAINGSTINNVTIAATQTDGCTYDDDGMQVPCSLYGLDIIDAAIGDGIVNRTITTEPAPTENLASTGSNSGNVLIVGSALVLFGAASMLVARRRSHLPR
jgi:LPXTG-motif cell wall-anchored protein